MTGRRRYGDLHRWARSRQGWAWLLPLIAESEEILSGDGHGDLPRWREAVARLPAVPPCFDGSLPTPVLGRDVPDPDALAELLMQWHPWRKGPLHVAGVRIDAEWRSDWKWRRVAGAVDLHGHRVLDVGCGNGYFGWRMLGAGAERVIGVDPTLVFVMQWLVCRHFAGRLKHHVLPLGVEALPRDARCFDSVFSMGVLYHRKDPVRHLAHLGRLARPGGQVIVETLILRQPGDAVLEPDGRYARMRNVWAVPTKARLMRWFADAGLGDVETLDISATTTREQRSTAWMRFESLAQCLDPADPACTVEGYPAPVRALFVMRSPA